MKIYIVTGETGEFEDRTDWNVCAYTSQEKAKHRVEILTQLVDQLPKMGRYYCFEESEMKPIRTNPDGDPKFRMDSLTGTHYGYYELELVE